MAREFSSTYSAFAGSPFFESTFYPRSNLHDCRRCPPYPRCAPRTNISAEASPGGRERSSPVWADGGPLSAAVSALTRSPLYPGITKAARKVLISTVEKRGFGWGEFVQDLERRIPIEARDDLLKAISDPDLIYPDYYRWQFHGYQHGNLAWLPAFEAEPATMAMSARVYKKETHLTCEEASARLRKSYLDAVFSCAPPGFGLRRNFKALDVGCGVGISTCALTTRLQELRSPGGDNFHVVGYDASPYMIAVADVLHKPSNVSYDHGLGESCNREDGSIDWYNTQFMIHELPASAIRAVCQEAHRVLQSGGVLSLNDMDPTSDVIQNLSPVLFTLMKSTEPYLDEYFALDMEPMLRDIGFATVTITRTSPRHRAIVAIK
jgi:ubiquinone/menaquinone biosynthesis C-methylase UbiE